VRVNPQCIPTIHRTYTTSKYTNTPIHRDGRHIMTIKDSTSEDRTSTSTSTSKNERHANQPPTNNFPCWEK